MGGRRSVERSLVEYRTRLLHAKRQRVTNQRCHLQVDATNVAIQARRRLARRGARTNQRVRTEGRVPAGVRAPGAARLWAATARVRAAQEKTCCRRPVRNRSQAAIASPATP